MESIIELVFLWFGPKLPSLFLLQPVGCWDRKWSHQHSASLWYPISVKLTAAGLAQAKGIFFSGVARHYLWGVFWGWGWGLVWFFRTSSLCVNQEFWTWALTCPCLCFPCAGIRGMHYHTWLVFHRASHSTGSRLVFNWVGHLHIVEEKIHSHKPRDQVGYPWAPWVVFAFKSNGFSNAYFLPVSGLHHLCCLFSATFSGIDDS